MFSFKKRLFGWGTFEAHMTQDVRKLLKQIKTDCALIPAGCTKYVQAPDVVWKKPSKGDIMESYHE